ncbi:DegV family protein [Actinomyces vulturis]|uniref:DegV family protein n=1 Tax=Actinomyces vulturis TaxID=1857645 RepID=UPI00159EEDFC|nr:DegV family protein [Actinomyces vulturis]
MSWAIVTDSSSAISPQTAREWGVRVVDLHVIMDGVDYKDSDISCEQVLAHSEVEIPSTAAASTGELAAVYRRALDEADHVLALHMSAKLSSLYAMAECAARQCDPAGERMVLVDSRTAGSALGLIVREMVRYLGSGARDTSDTQGETAHHDGIIEDHNDGSGALKTETVNGQPAHFSRDEVQTLAQELVAASEMTVGMAAMTHAAHGGRIDRDAAEQALNLPLHPTMVMDDGQMRVHHLCKTLKTQRREMLHHIADLIVERSPDPCCPVVTRSAFQSGQCVSNAHDDSVMSSSDAVQSRRFNDRPGEHHPDTSQGNSGEAQIDAGQTDIKNTVRLAVEYVDEADIAKKLVDQLRKDYAVDPWITQAAASTALHVGPGGLAISLLTV